jgi:hypothetical protein
VPWTTLILAIFMRPHCYPMRFPLLCRLCIRRYHLLKKNQMVLVRLKLLRHSDYRQDEQACPYYRLIAFDLHGGCGAADAASAPADMLACARNPRRGARVSHFPSCVCAPKGLPVLLARGLQCASLSPQQLSALRASELQLPHELL